MLHMISDFKHTFSNFRFCSDDVSKMFILLNVSNDHSELHFRLVNN